MAPNLSNASSSASPLQAGGCTDSVITLDSLGFSAGGHLFLTDVPLNVTAAPSPYSIDGKSLASPGCFVGFDAAEPNSRHVAPVGRLSGIRFMCIFRFMVWRTTHRTGYDGRDLEHETQIMILDRSDSGRPYVLLLPLLEGPFRASIQPGSDDFVDLCVESGSTQVTSDRFQAILYLHAGDDPFVLIRDAIKVARRHLGTFKPLSEKNPPPIVDKFGWCTWDEPYFTVHPQGIREGVKGLADGGCPPGFVLIDDGWQCISHDADRQMLCRLLKFLKEEFVTVEHVYVWHSLCGYGVRLVPPEMVHLMYEGLHSDFRSVGIDGVKVVDIHLPEMLGENYGGRVELAKAYYKALTESVRKHFNGNGVIASMENCNDFMFLGTEAISLGRVGDEFWCPDPSDNLNITFWLQGCHMVHCAYNSLWMGNFIQPDWDMFQSTHPCAEFHAASRAISGGPIYVNDSVGKHNFSLLKKLVLPDGSILRCEYYALPTQDCLFVDPVHDGKTMLKMWNLNKFTGVIGAFNCQGGGWCRESRRNKCTAQFPRPATCKTSPKDVEWNSGKSPIPVDGVHIFALYLSQSKRLVLYKPSQDLEITLEPFEFELVTVSPVTELEGSDRMVEFAPIGLANMLNTGGALQSLKYGEGSVEVGVKGSGELKAFSSVKPSHCKINGKDVEFEYAGLMATVQVPWPGSSSELSSVEFLF